jgi:hypothetical protein
MRPSETHRLIRRGEELERNVVGVAEREPGAVRSLDDAAVRDPKFAQPLLPRLEF